MKQYLNFTLCILIFTLLTACGSTPNTSSDSGAVSFNIKLSRPATAYQTAYLTGNDICIDYGITTINASVLNSSGATVATGSWSCSTHQGTVTGVPPGSGYTVRIEGIVSGNTVVWQGEKSGLDVTAGELTPAGVIPVVYIGNDTSPPVITSSTPAIDAAGVPVTSVITAIFSEKMAASSVTTTNFTLKQGATPVSGSVVYDAGTTIAIFIPSNNLSYSTTYTATLTTDIEDMAGNKIASGYSWSFTTEDPPSSIPSAPTGVTATVGSGQVTLNWHAVSGATYYNIYWSTTSGVTKATGTKIPNATSPYPHKGLSNGTTYYYVVTAANQYNESSESSEVNATPGSIDSTPPTGYISISSDALYTTSTSATLTLSASDQSGISQMCISNTTSCSSWEAYTTSKSWTLPTGDGTKVVYAWFKDTAGNSNTSPYSASITLDTTPPTNTSGSNFINSGASLTTTSSVSLTISATDNEGVAGYYASESPNTPSSNAAGWTSVTSQTSYSGEVSFNLSSRKGTKTVYVWFKDATGNVSAVVSDSIVLPDSIRPSNPSVSINSRAALPTSASVTLSLSATDDSGVTGYCAKEASTTPATPAPTDTCWTSVTSTENYLANNIAFTLSSDNGTKTVYAWFKDAAGNVSEQANDTIKLPLVYKLLKLSDTGQTGDFTTTFGEDSDYTINPPSYTDNRNGTITDNVTGLIWQNNNNYSATWDNAITYCDYLFLAGYSDWRLPSKKELISIVNYGTSNTAINSTYFPNTNASPYWSSTYLSYLSNAWYVNFDDGNFYSAYKGYSYNVRCVRGGQ